MLLTDFCPARRTPAPAPAVPDSRQCVGEENFVRRAEPDAGSNPDGKLELSGDIGGPPKKLYLEFSFCGGGSQDAPPI